MTNERRRSPRVKVNLQARWEGVIEQQEATVTDLSSTGCFVLTGGKVEPKELVRVEIEIPEGEPLVLWAEVVDAAYEIGFAVKRPGTAMRKAIAMTGMPRWRMPGPRS